MFGVFAVIEILYYCGLPITDPAHKATLLGSKQTNITILLLTIVLPILIFTDW